MANVDDSIALAVVGTAVFGLANMWQSYAPTLADLRSSHRDDIAVKQKLVDAEITVGMVAFVGAAALILMAKNLKGGLLVLVTFAWLAYYYHQVLAAASV